MECANKTAEGLIGWLSTVAYKMLRKREHYIDREDLIQEGVLAVLKSGAGEDGLAKVVALRAMVKYRDRQGLVRTSKSGHIIGRSEYDDLQKLSYESKPDGIFWDNLSTVLPADRLDTLRQWVEGTDSADAIGRRLGVPGRTVRDQLCRSLAKVAERWGADPQSVTVVKT